MSNDVFYFLKQISNKIYTALDALIMDEIIIIMGKNNILDIIVYKSNS